MDPIYKGRISFIQHEKKFATIEYAHGSKNKSVNFKLDMDDTGKKVHQFRIGDHVSFQLKLSDRGDKMAAVNVRFLHNVSLDLLLQQAAIENRFSGYLKIIDGKYFVKELNSYILFPLRLSPWEVPPPDTSENDAISFKLINLDKPNGQAAELFSHNYLPIYKKALQHFNHKMDTDAIITRVSPHAVYVQLFEGQMTGKLSLEGAQGLKEGDSLRVVISHMSPQRIVLKPAN